MSDIAIRVDHVSKRYRLGEGQAFDNVRDAVAHAAKTPLRWLRSAKPRTADSRPLSPDSGDEILWALRDVSFEVKRGEVLGIIGRNGAGKSTLLKILSRITEPSDGAIDVFGRVASLLEVGTGFHQDLTGRENIYLNGSILGMTKKEIDRKFDEIVAFAGVERFIDTPVKRYSSGMGVRLGFAVAAHLEPEILIVDEVLAVGDMEFQTKCIGKMNDVAKSGRTVLFVSHNMAAVELLCSRGLLLGRGELVADGDTDMVIRRYVTHETAAEYDVDLENHPHRVAITSPVLRRLRITDDGARTITSVQLGEPFTIELTLGSPDTIRGVVAGIHIYSSLGQRVATFHSGYQAQDVTRISGTTVLRCRTDRCQLMPGRYSIVLGVAAGNTQLDRIDPCTFFDVMPKDFYGTGKLPPDRDGVFLPTARWTVVEEARAKSING